MTRIDRGAVRAVVAKDLLAVTRSASVVVPMLLVPALLLVALPALVGLAAGSGSAPDVTSFLAQLPADVAEPVARLPRREQLVVLVNGYLMAPLFLIVPITVSCVLAADAFAGERERRTLETLLHLPIDTRDLFLAKLLGAFAPAVAVSWLGFACFALVANATAWPILGRVFVPTALWLVVILWVGPAVAALSLGVMVRVSARATSAQEANQLGSVVVLPLVFLAVGQATGLLLVDLPVALAIGGGVWVVAGLLCWRGARRFTRDRLASAS